MRSSHLGATVHVLYNNSNVWNAVMYSIDVLMVCLASVDWAMPVNNHTPHIYRRIKIPPEILIWANIPF